MFKTSFVAALLLSGSAFAAEPARVQYSGWGSGPIGVSLIQVAKKEAPVRGVEPSLAGFTQPVMPAMAEPALQPDPNATVTVALVQAVLASGGEHADQLARLER